MARNFAQSCLVAIWVLALLARGTFPYNPARAFLSTRDGQQLVYLFIQPTSASAFQLLSLNVSTTLTAPNLPYSTLSPSLPFLADGTQNAFTPVMDGGGDILVFAGSCSLPGQRQSIWRFVVEGDNEPKGRWIQQNMHVDEQPSADGVVLGAHFLTTGIPFQDGGDDDGKVRMYVFGGMCPTDTANEDGWVQSATYANTMIELAPFGSLSMPQSVDSTSEYSLSLTRSRGPPVAAAGYSITSLQPYVSNNAASTKSRQQNYVLLGGHTKDAFVNISQVALFSLPEETWSYLPIESELPSTSGGLLVRDNSDALEPRSGHTAILTPDGERLVVFGGWVGDTSIPAQPQLLILEVGQSYGGAGDWKWTTPTTTGVGLEADAGIYGHGAVMLPGGVMMVVGGYSIPSTKSAKRRRSGQLMNENTYFFNATSNSWLSSYTNPDRPNTRPAGALSEKSSAFSTVSKKAAIGSGVGVGLAVLVAAVCFWLWCSQRRRKRRRVREAQLRSLSFTAQRPGPEHGATGDIHGEKSGAGLKGPNRLAMQENPYPWSGGAEGSFGEGEGWKQNGGTEAERTGLLFEVPSPSRGLRRSLQSRGRNGEKVFSYHLAPGHDEHRRSFAGSIHPIDERDELEPPAAGDGAQPGAEAVETMLLPPSPSPDPFRDQDPLAIYGAQGSSPKTTSPARERELEVQEWVSDWNAAEAHMLGTPGRTSPDRSSPDKDRTSSNLSEKSARSAVSAHSHQPSAGSISRSISQRSAAILSSANPFRSPVPSPTTSERPGGRNSPEYRRANSLTLFGRPRSMGNPPIGRTARPDFTQLRAEGETLLPRPEAYSNAPESPTTIKSRASGWMGSMRRALPFGAGGSSNDEHQHASAMGGERSNNSSPTKSTHLAPEDLPRRAASAGAAYWRRKKGAADWGAETSAAGSSRNVAGGPGDDGDDEWDVEAAIERRVVQVMFTVPKEKLRVVNSGGETDSLSLVDGEEKKAQEARDAQDEPPDGEKGKGKERAQDGG